MDLYESEASLVWDSKGYTEKSCLEKQNKGWRDGSAVKGTDCSSRGPEFNFQQPHSGSQPSAVESDYADRLLIRINYVNKYNKNPPKPEP